MKKNLGTSLAAVGALAAIVIAPGAGAQIVRDVNPAGPLESRPSFGGYYDVHRGRPLGATDLREEKTVRRELEPFDKAHSIRPGQGRASDTCLAESRTARLTPTAKAFDALAICVRDNP